MVNELWLMEDGRGEQVKPATLNGVIQTYGGVANYFPGSVAGTTATGGQYA